MDLQVFSFLFHTIGALLVCVLRFMENPKTASRILALYLIWIDVLVSPPSHHARDQELREQKNDVAQKVN